MAEKKYIPIMGSGRPVDEPESILGMAIEVEGKPGTFMFEFPENGEFMEFAKLGDLKVFHISATVVNINVDHASEYWRKYGR